MMARKKKRTVRTIYNPTRVSIVPIKTETKRIVKNILERQRLARVRAAKKTAVGVLSAPLQRRVTIKTTTSHGIVHSPKARDKTKVDKKPALLSDRPTCKVRPDARKARQGRGGSRPYIPWCERKR